ncbi:unnamed protein product [Closterium sp. Naga37s-1]|nr:unnamed protein product [Closterium sp. Naga37s-1]
MVMWSVCVRCIAFQALTGSPLVPQSLLHALAHGLAGHRGRVAKGGGITIPPPTHQGACMVVQGVSATSKGASQVNATHWVPSLLHAVAHGLAGHRGRVAKGGGHASRAPPLSRHEERRSVLLNGRYLLLYQLAVASSPCSRGGEGKGRT